MKPQELRKIAEGREAEMFEWEGGTLLRLMRSPEAQRQNEWQAAALEAARAAGVRVPEVRGLATVMGRPGLVMERIEGTDLLTIVGKQPWTALRAARISGETQARLHGVEAPKTLPALKGTLRERIQSLAVLPKQYSDLALGALEALPDGDRLCHGDFHPGNILMTGETPVLIDWTNATRGDPAADVAHTRLLLSIGEPPPEASLALRGLSLFGRKALMWLHLRSYRRQRALDMALVRRWELPLVAARLADGIPEERKKLLRLIERGR